MTIEQKQRWMLHECRYKLHHFCDGTPNKSICKERDQKQYPPCPDRKDCPFKKVSVLEEDSK